MQTYNDCDDVGLLHIDVDSSKNKVFSAGFDERREPKTNEKFKINLTLEEHNGALFESNSTLKSKQIS